MQIDEKTFEITTSQYDYGIPVIFEAGIAQGFSIGDKVVLCFNTDKIEDRVFDVDAYDYKFSFALTKNEADNLYKSQINGFVSIRYSIKRYVEDCLLETLIDSNLIVKSTVKWGNGVGGETNG